MIYGHKFAIEGGFAVNVIIIINAKNECGYCRSLKIT